MAGRGHVSGAVLAKVREPYQVVQSVQKVGSPEGVRRAVGYVVAQTAHGAQPATCLIGQITDNCLLRCVESSPVSCPAYTKSMQLVDGLTASMERQSMFANLPGHSFHPDYRSGRGHSPCRH